MKHRILLTLLCIIFINLAFGQTGKIQESTLNKELVAILDSIYQEDQNYRLKSEDLEKKYGWDSKEVQDLWKIINIKDSINLIKVEKILFEYGWLGSDVVGVQGNITLFLVIQHSDHKTQLKYLSMMREAVKKGNAEEKDLALLEDRVALGEGQKQIYGSQLEMDYKTNLLVLSPMIDPDNVDKRRNEVGLNPIAEYLKFYDLTWDVESFKKRMEEYDSEMNKK
jgi:hypothetical protein